MDRREREALDRYLTTEPHWRTEGGEDNEEVEGTCSACGFTYYDHIEVLSDPGGASIECPHCVLCGERLVYGGEMGEVAEGRCHAQCILDYGRECV